MKRLSLPNNPRHRDCAGSLGGLDSRSAESLARATATVETNDASRRKKGASRRRLSKNRITEPWTRHEIARRISRFVWAALLLLVPMLAPPARAAEDSYAWLQFAANGLQARAVTGAIGCPLAEIDGVAAEMTPRALPDSAFPVLVCALDIPRTAKSALVSGQQLRPPPARANNIIVLGDTGCRLKGLYWQECNSEEGWPFRKIASTAAAFAPDIVLHVGDYYYREAACPPLWSSCAGSPHGDNWEAWKADFFEPAAALLSAAPWVFVRGNHENCARGGRGWARLLSPFPFAGDGACTAREPSYRVDLGGPTLLVMDVTAAEDRAVDSALAPVFARELAAGATIAGPVWYAFHKPIYSTLRIVDGTTIGDNKTLADAARGRLPANVQAILSGHLHIFQIASYVQDFPVQLVVGHGGDAMDMYAPPRFDGLEIGPVTVETGRSIAGKFGFAALERIEDEWRVTDRDAQGRPLLRCRLQGHKLDCDEPAP